MKNFVFVFVIFRLIFCEEILEGCTYDERDSLLCQDIVQAFPNQYYQSRILKCVDCNITNFTKLTFPYENQILEFNASYSEIRKVSSYAFSKLINAEFLHLDHNRIDEMQENSFFGISQMYELHLHFNELENINRKTFNNLTVSFINLSHNKLKSVADHAFEGTNGLITLDLSHNFIKKIIGDSFSGLVILENLNLRKNVIDNIPLGTFSYLQNLRILNLSSNSVSKLSYGSLSGLNSLRELDLSSNNLDFDGNFLISLPSLIGLDISENKIINFSNRVFQEVIIDNVPTLKFIRMDGNIFHCQALKHIVQILRKANIEMIFYPLPLPKMVLIHIKHKDESQFLYETKLGTPIDELLKNIVSIYNGRLKVQRVCSEIEELSKHGILYPPEILGLTPDQVEEMKLVDPYEEKCIPSGGFILNKDPIGRRNGRQPKKEMQIVLQKAVEEAKEMISKNTVVQGKTMTMKIVQEALNLLKGAVTIVYPMKLPPHDVIRMEFENIEDLSGTQASLDVLDPATAQLWFCGKEIFREGTLSDYVGKVENCKVIMKLGKKGSGPPAREPIMNEDERKQMMAYAYKKQEEFKKLHADDDCNYLNSEWADSSNMKRSFHGLTNISWRPGGVKK